MAIGAADADAPRIALEVVCEQGGAPQATTLAYGGRSAGDQLAAAVDRLETLDNVSELLPLKTMRGASSS